MLIKDSFPFFYYFYFYYFLFSMLPNTGKHEKLYLHKVFHQNKQSVHSNVILEQIILDIICKQFEDSCHIVLMDLWL